ncbi:helix-turn-helix transcriptional regulator [Niveibacterium sp. SC-1]|uniref:helix-turn-helix domain-containing protein n=1 Tax=Niveibacterium sp. SC-1 TaxID=3135646 RepID=UPI00311EDDFE
MALKSFAARLRAAKESDSYWVEHAKHDFAFALNELMNQRGVSQVELAERLAVSPAAVSRALRGDANLTIETIVKFARALQGEVVLAVRATARTGSLTEAHSVAYRPEVCSWSEAPLAELIDAPFLDEPVRVSPIDIGWMSLPMAATS